MDSSSRQVGDMSERVCAIITTYNRLALLKQCVSDMRAQTSAPDEIIVVDNASSDGTQEWLDAQPDLFTMHQSNVGGAGAFKRGLAEGYARGCQWFWCFDDDCRADPNALKALRAAIAQLPNERVLNSFSLALEDVSRPTHGAVCLRTNASDFLSGEFVYTADAIRARAGERGILDSIGGQLYLGTLIHRDVIAKVGLPQPALFMRGDEIDYSLRIMQAGYHIWLVTDSITYHPAAPIVYLNVFGKRLPCEMMNSLKRYYGIRNSIYLRKKFYARQPFLPYVTRRVAGALLTELVVDRQKNVREKWAGCAAALRGARDGLSMQIVGEK